MDIKNLFDETYVSRGADAAGAVTGGIPLTEPGRTVGFYVKADF